MDFASALRTFAIDCDFGTFEDELLMRQLSAGCYPKNAKLKILQQKMTNCEGLVELIISAESVSCVSSSDSLLVASENGRIVSS